MTQADNRAEFESLGIDDVRRRVSASTWSEAKLKEAREWISLEESRIARSAKNAAWTAATAAMISAIAAIAAVICAAVAIAISLGWKPF